MIISHRHKFIFMHCRKAAGSSVKVMLSRHMGPSDIQIGAWPETRADGVKFNRRFLADCSSAKCLRNFLVRIHAGQPFINAINSAHKKRYAAILGDMPEHAPAARVAEAFPMEWGRYVKLCFVRNPYAQVVSAWKFRMREIQTEFPFSLFLSLIEEGAPDHRVPVQATNWPIYTIEDKVVADFVGRVENLRSDIERMFATLSLPPPTKLPHAKMSPVTDYRDLYSADDRRRASRIFAAEIETFSYQF